MVLELSNNKETNMRTDTVTASITFDEIWQAEYEYNKHQDELAELERIIGTYETYGAICNIKPALSKHMTKEQDNEVN